MGRGFSKTAGLPVVRLNLVLMSVAVGAIA